MDAEKKDQLGRKIGVATNTAGAIAGPAALYGAFKGRKEGGMPRGLARDLGNKLAGAKNAKLRPTGKRIQRGVEYLNSPKSRKAKVAAGALGAGAVGLQAANWAGDAIAARTLAGDSKKKPVNKSFEVGVVSKSGEVPRRGSGVGYSLNTREDSQ